MYRRRFLERVSENESLVVGVWMMRPGEDRIVARRLREVLGRKVS